MPRDFTVGRVSAAEEYGRRVREIMIGLGYQEMIYGYLGAKKDFVEKMCMDGADAVEIANPMTESYDMVRNSIIPNLLASEAESAHAVYPHRIFEIGKIVVRTRRTTRARARTTRSAFLHADREAGFNEVDAHVLALVLLPVPRAAALARWRTRASSRAARRRSRSTGAGSASWERCIRGCCPNWGIEMPCAAVEILLDLMRGE